MTSVWFANASIRRKLTVVVTVTTTVALLLSGIALGAYEVLAFRRALAEKVTTVADIVGRNSTAALSFADHAVAQDVLQALEAEPAVSGGAIYDSKGHLFATYPTSRLDPRPLPTTPGNDGTQFNGNQLIVVHPIILDGERVGTVYIRAGLRDLMTRMLVFITVLLIVVTISTLIALSVSTGLQRSISDPILGLARTAQRVTSDRNFALRATLVGRDEVGTLVDDFNRMLEEIEQQDYRLRRHQEDLESEVAHRTQELVAANEQLVISVQRIKSYADQIGQLTALTQLLQTCQTSHEIFDVVRHAMRRLFPDDSGALAVLNASRNIMEVTAIWGLAPPKAHVLGPDDCWAFRRGRAHVVANRDSALRCAHLTPEDGPVVVCVPMTANGDALGILQFNFRETEEPDSDDKSDVVQSTRARLAVAMAEHIALALSNLRLREALRNQSTVDPLTGLFNRRYLEQMLERECRRALRSGRPLSVIMLDVDRFKQFNDTWGHDGGDAVLREVGVMMRSFFRGEDIACRYGGEEFVVLLADASLEVAAQRAEELRLLVHQLAIRHRNEIIGSITISLGIAALPDHADTAKSLLGAADRALYEAKRAGRDRVVAVSAAFCEPGDVIASATS